MSRVLAVDGGNTKTLAAVADETGRTLGMGKAGTADIYNAPTPGHAVEAVAAAVDQALAAAGGARAADLERELRDCDHRSEVAGRAVVDDGRHRSAATP